MSITWQFDASKKNLWNNDRQASLVGFIEDLSTWYEDEFKDLGKIYISDELLDVEKKDNGNKWLDKIKGMDDVQTIEITLTFDDYNKGYWQEELGSLIDSILCNDKKAGYIFLYESSCFWACTHRVDGGYADWSKETFSSNLVWSDWSYEDDDEDDE